MEKAYAAAMTLPPQISKEIRESPTLAKDLASLTGFGGRFGGSQSEQRAFRWLGRRLRAMSSAVVQEHCFAFDGWRATRACLTIDGARGPSLCHPLVLSPETPSHGLEAEVVHLGRGSEDDFDRRKRDLAGRIALVEHEYPFSDTSIHRRLKYNRSRDEGCVAFIIANNLPDGGLITGSSGEGTANDIPAVGVEYKSGCALFSSGSPYPRVRLKIKCDKFPATGTNLIAEPRINISESVVVCAHYDGHDLAESALDNATGVVAALRIFEALLPYASSFRRKLRLALFTNEEWRLAGSRGYVSSLSNEELSDIALVVNLDTLAGSSSLGVITSGFEELQSLAERVSSENNQKIVTVQRLLPNSDHFNFAIQGVPSLRIIAGYNDPDARARYLLTSKDLHSLVDIDELKDASIFAARLIWRALTMDQTPARKGRDVMQKLLKRQAHAIAGA